MKYSNRPQGAYSQRYSNAATNDPAFTTQKDPGSGGIASYRIITSANDPSMGDVEIQVGGYGSGSFTSKVAQERYSRFTPSGGTYYPAGTRLIITAKPNPGYRFISWSGVSGANHTASSIIVNVDRNMTFTAMFQKIPQQTRTVHVRWNTTMGRVTAPGATMTNGDFTANAGDLVKLEATPNQGYHFVRWNGAPVSGQSDPAVSFNVNNNYTIHAVFAKDNPATGDNPPGNGESTDPNLVVNIPEINGGPGGNGSSPELNETPYHETFTEKAMSFVKQWWWALAIVAYVVYKETKGGSK